MARAFKWLGVLAVGATLTGCASQGDLKSAQSQRDKALAERDLAMTERDQFKTEAEVARAEAENFKEQLGAVMTDNAKFTELSQENSDLKAQLDSINKQYGEATTNGKSSMPPELAKKVEEFAQQNKDVVEFDSTKGLVRFKSDATFAPGSADLTPRGKQVAAKLADVLSSNTGKGYELMVAGHTDGNPVTKPTTIKKGHLDNWYLSAHRAIGVGKALQAGHVSPTRMAMVGYAEQRPVASNASEKGRAQNRRVEVLILPTKVQESQFAIAPSQKKADKQGKSTDKSASASVGFNK